MVLYITPHCGLCRHVETLIRRELDSTPFHLRVVSLDEVPELQERYRFTVPVVEIAGVARFEARFDRLEFRQLVRGQGRTDHPNGAIGTRSGHGALADAGTGSKGQGPHQAR